MRLKNMTCSLAPCMTGLAGLLVLTARVEGAPFAYLNCDLVACFRVVGGADLVVNLGPAPQFEDLPWGTTVALTNVISAQLASALPTLNEVHWSVLGAMRGNTNYPQYFLQTVWATSASPAPDVLGPVWKRQSQFSQGAAASQIDGIGSGAVAYGSQQPSGPDNTATGIVIPSNNPGSYTSLMTTAGNLEGTFQGRVENITPVDFDQGQSVSRSALYKLEPASGATLNTFGQLLGYFDFRADSTLTFVAGPPPGRIATVQQEDNLVVLSFSTVPSVSYRLRFTDAPGLSAPVSSWAAGGDVVVGNGSTRFLSHTADATAQFYTVEALP